ncbi:reverse transcriptase domain-containing protein [Tanacetum coccineum]
MDRSSCIDGSGAGLILMNPEGMEFTYALRFRFDATNNKAEYEALIVGLRIVEQMGVKKLQANIDSRLVANQVYRTYIAKEPGMIKYLEKVRTLTSTFKEFSIKQVPRGENKKADALSKMASTSFAHLSKQVLVEELKEKSINEKEVLAVVEEERPTWMTPIHEYLTKEIFLEEKRKARAIRRKAGRYAMTNGILYKKSFLGPWLWCVGLLQTNYVLREIHDGSCSMHAGPRSMVVKALRSGYYLPTMNANARKLIRGCNSCQVHRPVPRNPFGFPREIISDSGKQFRDNPFKDWCKKLCIRQCFASVKHPQANGLVERANTSLGVVIQVDIGMPTLRTAEVDMIKNDEALEINLDLLERKESRQQYRKQKAKLRWKNTTMPEFAIQVSGQETSSTRTKRAMQKMEVSSDLSGKDHTRSQKH